MRIHVCLKEIQNPEISASIFKIDEEQRVAIPLAGLPLVTSPFDEQAIEAALRIRDKGATCRITALSFGPDTAQRAIKRALSMGVDDGSEIVEAPMPCVVTVSNELGEPRKASLRETMRAAKKPIEKWTCESIGITPGNLPFEERPQQRERLFIPTKDACCEMVTGASPDEVAKNLVSRLATTRLI